jgi:hypothetical protein
MKDTESILAPKAFDFRPDTILQLGKNEVRMHPAALQEIKAWAAQNKRIRGQNVETGGLLWGEWDEATGIIWISDASGPPPDSKHSEELFLCGTRGTKEEHLARTRLTRFSIGYIGTWHTHPISQPLPSGTDLIGMHKILTDGPLPPRKGVLVILGKHAGVETAGVYLFRRISGNFADAEYEIHECRIRLDEAILW